MWGTVPQRQGHPGHQQRVGPNHLHPRHGLRGRAHRQPARQHQDPPGMQTQLRKLNVACRQTPLHY